MIGPTDRVSSWPLNYTKYVCLFTSSSCIYRTVSDIFQIFFLFLFTSVSKHLTLTRLSEPHHSVSLKVFLSFSVLPWNLFQRSRLFLYPNNLSRVVLCYFYLFYWPFLFSPFISSAAFPFSQLGPSYPCQLHSVHISCYNYLTDFLTSTFERRYGC
jgi:hypothetical protein